MLRHIGRNATLACPILDGRYCQRGSHTVILGKITPAWTVEVDHLIPLSSVGPRCGTRTGLRHSAIAPQRVLPQGISPGRQPLGRPDVVKQFRGSEGIQIRFNKPACKLSTHGLAPEWGPLPFPLLILGGLPRNQLPKQKIHHARAHGLKHSG